MSGGWRVNEFRASWRWRKRKEERKNLRSERQIRIARGVLKRGGYGEARRERENKGAGRLNLKLDPSGHIKGRIESDAGRMIFILWAWIQNIPGQGGEGKGKERLADELWASRLGEWKAAGGCIWISVRGFRICCASL